jgi:hypothetical protein
LGSDPFWDVTAAQIRLLRKGKVRQEWNVTPASFAGELPEIPGNCEVCVRLTLR